MRYVVWILTFYFNLITLFFWTSCLTPKEQGGSEDIVSRGPAKPWARDISVVVIAGLPTAFYGSPRSFDVCKNTFISTSVSVASPLNWRETTTEQYRMRCLSFAFFIKQFIRSRTRSSVHCDNDGGVDRLKTAYTAWVPNEYVLVVWGGGGNIHLPRFHQTWNCACACNSPT